MPRNAHRAAWTYVGILVVAGPYWCVATTQPARGTGSAPECNVPRRPAAAAGNLTVPDRPPPCRIAVVPTGVVLRGDAQGRHPDPGAKVATNHRGLFFTSSGDGFPGLVLAWDARGRFLKTIGGPGAGPGEFDPRDDVNVFLGRDGRLHVRDGAATWSVFDTAHKFVSKVASPSLGGSNPDNTAVLDDGRIVTGDLLGADPTNSLHITDTRGTIHARFAPLVSVAPRDAREGRSIAYAGGSTFWASPIQGSHGYRLEEWTTAGMLKRAITRTPSWYPRVTSSSPVGPPPPHVGIMSVDSAGVMVVFVTVPTDKWRPTDDPREREQMRDGGGIQVYFEAIDTRSGLLLASDVMGMREARNAMPRRIPGSELGFRVLDSQSGTPYLEIVRFRLVPR